MTQHKDGAAVDVQQRQFILQFVIQEFVRQTDAGVINEESDIDGLSLREKERLEIRLRQVCYDGLDLDVISAFQVACEILESLSTPCHKHEI